MKKAVLTTEEISKIYGRIYNVMIVRKALGKSLSLEMTEQGISPELVMQRSGIKQYYFETLLSGGSLGTVSKNNNFDLYIKIAESIPIPMERFLYLLRNGVIEDNAEYNRTHIDRNKISIGYFPKKKPKYKVQGWDYEISNNNENRNLLS